MTDLLELSQLRTWIDDIDRRFVQLIGEREKLAREVARVKDRSGQTLQASDREASLLARVERNARVLGVSFDSVALIFSCLIWRSKQTQCDELGWPTFLDQSEKDPAELRANLLELTKRVSATYDLYCGGSGSDAIGTYLRREDDAILQAVEGLPHREQAIDLGAAIGLKTEVLQTRFDRVRAYDVSPDMCEAARRRRDWAPGVSFEQVDLDRGIPLQPSTVSFAVANFGAASEIRGIVSEVARVLKPGGRALLSYYNRDALVNHWFYPWPATIRARLNPFNDTVEVWADDAVFAVQGRGVTIDEVIAESEEAGLRCDLVETFPTVQAIIPRFFFEDPRFEEFVRIAREIDSTLAKRDYSVSRGTYVMAVVER